MLTYHFIAIKTLFFTKLFIFVYIILDTLHPYMGIFYNSVAHRQVATVGVWV